MSTTSPNSGISEGRSVRIHEPVGNSSRSKQDSGPHVVEYSGHLFYVMAVLHFIAARTGHAILQRFLPLCVGQMNQSS